MSYTSLYRKFRPTTFSEMVGQEHITKTIKNQIIADRIGHAYLFCGGRGTGKTSIAKIMARAVNCLNPKDGEPCNKCEICKSALSGSLTDIVEMDAASNNSVEDIRAIRDEVNFLPAVAKYRVYIIDEVHMLSTGAFNALLKTLEEPPKHVKFILATTESQKLPATILSRCQRFDFKRISTPDIIKRLNIICKEINISITDGALNMIAILSEGALRDAISILERCIQDATEKDEIDENKIRELVGIPKLEAISKVSTGLINKDVNNIVATIHTVMEDGKDLDNFLWEIIKYIKDILIYKTTKHLDLYSDEDLTVIKSLAEKTTNEQLLNLIYNLSKLASDMKNTTQKSLVFETGLLKECFEWSTVVPQAKISTSTVEKVKEDKKESLKAPINIEEKPKASKPKVATTNTTPGNALPYWNNVLDKIKQNGKMMLYANLIGTTAYQINDMTVEIVFNKKITDFARKVLDEYENKEFISKLVSMEAGNTMNVKLSEIGSNINKTNEKEKTNEIENIVGGTEIPFNVIDE